MKTPLKHSLLSLLSALAPLHAADDCRSIHLRTEKLVVEAAINAAPEQMRLITQCASATAPDALAEVQAVLARLDPNSGESGASDMDAKSAKDVVHSKYSD